MPTDNPGVCDLTSVFVTTLQTAVLVGAILGGLALVGYPVKRLLEACRSPLCVPTMVVGLAIVVVVAWYWFELGRRGLGWPMAVLLGLAGLFAAVDVARRRGEVLRVDQRGVRRAVASLAIGFVVVAVNWSTVLSLPLLTTADTDNNDAALYATYSEHLATKGFHDAGPIAGYDLGRATRIDAFGSAALVGSVSAVSRLGSWRVVVSTLLALIILCTYTLAIFIDTLLGGDRWLLASVAAGAASCTLLFVYVGILFFVGQVMAMAVVPLLAVIAIRFNRIDRGRQAAGPLVSAAAVFLVMASHYAHMLALGAPLFVLPVLIVRDDGERWDAVVRRAARTIALFVVAGLIAVAVVPVWLALAVDLVRLNGSVTAGFGLAGFTPPELLGFMRGIVRHPSNARFVWSGVCVAALAAMAYAVRSSYRPLVSYLARFSAVVFLSYWLIWRRDNGPSYRQWKWISFYQPTLVVLAVTVAAVAIERVVAARIGRRRGVALALAAVFAVVATANTGAGVGTALRDRRRFQFASAEHFGLSKDPLLKQLRDINIDLATNWDTMWAAYFLSGKHLYIQRTSYYAVTTPQATWTLVDRVGSLGGPPVHDINALFRLIHDDPAAPSSVNHDALGGTLTVSLDGESLRCGQLAGTLRATNSGKARWLPRSAASGAVAVSVRLDDDHGDLIESDWARVQLIDERLFDLPPDSTTDQPFRLPALPPGRYRLTFQLVSEHVAWFGSAVVEEAVLPQAPTSPPNPSAPCR
jgi:hypothetical protein